MEREICLRDVIGAGEFQHLRRPRVFLASSRAIQYAVESHVYYIQIDKVVSALGFNTIGHTVVVVTCVNALFAIFFGNRLRAQQQWSDGSQKY